MMARPTAQDAERVIARLKVLTPTQAIRDPELNRALAPFRGHPPTALMCANATCTRPFLWCALDPTTARVRFAAHGPAERPAAAAGRRPPAPFDVWEPAEHVGVTLAPPGEPLLRWLFFCPRCDRTCQLSNSRMITLVVRALGSDRTSATPAAE